jgi:hypothetical protein
MLIGALPAMPNERESSFVSQLPFMKNFFQNLHRFVALDDTVRLNA